MPDPPELSPAGGAPRLNKSLFNEAGFILSPDNKSTWAKFEINGRNPSQFIQSNRGYYVKKSSLKNPGQRPSWITDYDIQGLGYSSWSAIPGSHPVWSDAAVHWDSATKTWKKNGFPMGTGVYRGWRNVAGVCIHPMESSTFERIVMEPRDHDDDPTTPDVPTPVPYDVNLVVLRGAYGDAAPSPIGYVKPCELKIHQAEDFETFVVNHAGTGMTYIVFNEMPGQQIGMDVLDPDTYVFAYRYYWNMIKGHPGCGGSEPHDGWDTSANVMVGTGGQGVTGGFWGNSYVWMRKFHRRWLARSGSCSPSGPVQVCSRNGRAVVPSDGVPFYFYARVSAGPPENVDINDPGDVCSAYLKWKAGVVTVASTLQASQNQLFTNNTPVLKEFGIHRGKGPEGRPRPNEELLDNPLMGALTGRMVRFLRDGGMNGSNISSANWLTTYDYGNWKKSQATIPLARRVDPALGTQTFTGPHGGYATTLLNAYYNGIRGTYPYAQIDFGACALP